MKVNRHQPHVLVLPEDRANSQLANGFLLDLDLRTWRIQVLEEAGGWGNVLTGFVENEIRDMRRYPERFMVLLIDFDSQEERLDQAKQVIPEDLIGRVFVLGALTKPEDLRSFNKANLGSYETIGRAMAKDCSENTDTIWSHDLLRHNASELDRLRKHVRPILFR